MKTAVVFLLLYIFSVLLALGQVQPLVFEKVPFQEGWVPSFTCSIQDRIGFHWIGTYDGLYRYDGYSSKVYRFDSQDSTSLPINHVTSILEDKERRLWIGTGGGGLCKFDPKTEKFTRYYKQARQAGLVNQNILNVAQDSEGMIWIGTKDGASRFDPETETFTRIVHDPHDPSSISTNSTVSCFLLDRDGTFWIGTFDRGLNKMRIVPGKNGEVSSLSFTRFLHDAQSLNSLSSNYVIDICQDKAGAIWIATTQGLNRLDKATGHVKRFMHNPDNTNSLSDDRLWSYSLAVDEQDNLWIATPNGLNKLNPERTKFSVYYSNLPEFHQNKGFRTLYIDRTGMLWVNNGVLQKTDLNRRNITYVSYLSQNSKPTTSFTINAVVEDREENIWIATEQAGLFKYDLTTQETSQYNKSSSTGRLRSNRIKTVFEDSDGNIWIGQGRSWEGDGQISMFDPKSGRFQHFPATGISTIIEDSQGKIWFGTHDGIKSYDRKSKKWQHYPYDPNNPHGISDYFADAIAEDNAGYLWIGTNNGLNRFNPKTEKFIHYRHDPKDPNSIPNDKVTALIKDKKGIVWAGTTSGGMCRYNPATDNFSVYTEKDGLLNNTINSIVEDKDGELWLGTEEGICRFSPSLNLFTNVDLAGHPLLLRKDGSLYFSNKVVLGSFYPWDLWLNETVPPVFITQFSIYDKPLPGILERKQIELDYEENFFSFEFAALNYINSQSNQYAYQLEGVDRDWVYSGSRRFVSYTNIPPGEYVFRVKGSNNNGVWNEEGASLTIRIHPPWWQTWWAYTGYSLLLVVVLLLAWRETLRRERLRAGLRLKQVEADKLREIDTLKSRFFSNVSHEFRTPLALIQGTVQKLTVQDKPLPEYDLIYRSADRLLQLVNQLLDLSRLEAGKLVLKPVPGEVVSFLTLLASSFTSLFEDKGICYRYCLPQHPLWMLFEADKLEKILTNLLSNACKFTPSGGEVVLKVKAEKISSTKAALHISIQDTGIGIPAEMVPHIFERFFQADLSVTRAYEGAGIGLALTKELVELHDGTISVDSKSGEGTIFRISLLLQVTDRPGAERQEKDLGEQVLVPLQKEKYTLTNTTGEHQQEKHPKKDQIVVLVVEDNADLRYFVKNSLPATYAVLEAEDGNVGWEKALEVMPDLIISDVMMPGLDGVSLCYRLKKDERTSHIAVVLLTAKADTESKMAGLETGADEYLTKPFKLEELQVRVYNLIESRRKLRDRYSRLLTLEPSEVAVTSLDEKFLQKILAVMEANLSNVNFDVESFSREIGMSRAHLHRKLTALTGQSAGEFIRAFRLKRAASLLEGQAGNISDIAYQVGFNSLSYFTKCFRGYYGKTPSEYLHEYQPQER